MKIKKIIKVILIVLGIVLLAFISYITRNYIILSKINKQQINETGNIYYKQTQKEGDNIILTIENWQLDDNNYKLVFDNKKEGISETTIQRDEKYISYQDNGTDKTMYIEDYAQEDIDYEELDSENQDMYTLWDKFKDSIITKISTGVADGKKCYVIRDSSVFNYSMNVNDENGVEIPTYTKIYIDKSTGIIVKFEEITNNAEQRIVRTMNYEISFNTVTENDLAELDSKEYKLIDYDNIDDENVIEESE